MDLKNFIKCFCLFAAVSCPFTDARSTEQAQNVATTPSQALGEKSASDKIYWDLRRAVDKNDPAGARAAIEKGVDLERRAYAGRTPLHWAADWGHVEVMEVLLGAGAEVDAVSSNGNRPLHVAAMWGRDAAVSRLVKAGAYIYAVGSEGRTPLGWAVHRKHNSTAALLRSLGAFN